MPLCTLLISSTSVNNVFTEICQLTVLAKPSKGHVVSFLRFLRFGCTQATPVDPGWRPASPAAPHCRAGDTSGDWSEAVLRAKCLLEVLSSRKTRKKCKKKLLLYPFIACWCCYSMLLAWSFSQSFLGRGPN